MFFHFSLVIKVLQTLLILANFLSTLTEPELVRIPQPPHPEHPKHKGPYPPAKPQPSTRSLPRSRFGRNAGNQPAVPWKGFDGATTGLHNPSFSPTISQKPINFWVSINWQPWDQTPTGPGAPWLSLNGSLGPWAGVRKPQLRPPHVPCEHIY